jgi:hypothetical protein
MIITEISHDVKYYTQSAPAAPCIKVLTLHPITHRHIKASCTVQAGALSFDNILIVRKRHERPLVAMPKQVAALLTPALQEAIRHAVLAAWRNGGAR